MFRWLKQHATMGKLIAQARDMEDEGVKSEKLAKQFETKATQHDVEAKRLRHAADLPGMRQSQAKADDFRKEASKLRAEAITLYDQAKQLRNGG